MKTTAAIRRYNPSSCRRRTAANPFPNCASTRYFLEKILDAALAAVTTLGVVVAMLFLFTVLA